LDIHTFILYLNRQDYNFNHNPALRKILKAEK